MRTKRVPDPATVQKAEPPRPVGLSLPDEAEAYVASAQRVEIMAVDLAQRNVEDKVAIAALIEAAGGDVRVIRRAHRHCEYALSEHWPAGRTLIRAFDYLSAGRRQFENKLFEDVKVYDLIEEAGKDSFPASDAPSFWAR
jgi:hypothetical protein